MYGNIDPGITQNCQPSDKTKILWYKRNASVLEYQVRCETFEPSQIAKYQAHALKELPEPFESHLHPRGHN